MTNLIDTIYAENEIRQLQDNDMIDRTSAIYVKNVIELS